MAAPESTTPIMSRRCDDDERDLIDRFRRPARCRPAGLSDVLDKLLLTKALTQAGPLAARVQLGADDPAITKRTWPRPEAETSGPGAAS